VSTVIAAVNIIAGLSWDPAIRGILVVLVGVVVLLGSTYLLLATNTGVRLGLLIALGGLFGWLSILTLFWWIQPPGIGPRGGNSPHWVPLEIYVSGSEDAPRISEANSLFDALPELPADKATASGVLAAHPELAKQVPTNATLTDIAGAVAVAPDGTEVVGADVVGSRADLGGWRIVPTSEAGEGQTAADTALVASGLFSASTEYVKLDVYQKGGNPRRAEECPAGQDDPGGFIPSDLGCRIVARIQKTFRFSHPPNFLVVQVQKVIPQEAKPGEPPPTPKVDPDAPVISVIMIRDQGNVRAKPAAFFVISFSMFVFFSLLLHFRDKTAARNRDPEAAASGSGRT
jgi:hypothetical protein